MRYSVLGLLFLYITFSGYMHQRYQAKFPSVDAICPFGAIESLYNLIFQGHFLNRVLSSAVILLIITMVLVLFSGRSFCAWICPLGALQGIMDGLGKRIFGRRKNIPSSRDNKVRFLRFLTLIIFTLGAWYGGKLLIRPYDPWVAWMHLSEFSHAIEEFPIGMFILLLLLIFSLFIPRSFCRYLCPMGAFLSLLNKLSINRLKRRAETCNQCTLCERKCPVGIEVSREEVVDKIECISCGECVSVCPVPDTLHFQIAGKWNLSSLSIGIIVFVIFFGTIITTSWSGLYSSSPPSVKELKASGQYKPEMIKGYMTLSEVAFLFDVKISRLYEQLGLNPGDVPANTKCKEIGELIGRKFDTDTVRVGVGILLKIPENEIKKSCAPGSITPTFITGTMTLKEVSDQFNIPLNTLYSHLGLSLKKISPDTQCRQLKSMVDPGFHTSRVREVVNKLVKK